MEKQTLLNSMKNLSIAIAQVKLTLQEHAQLQNDLKLLNSFIELAFPAETTKENKL